MACLRAAWVACVLGCGVIACASEPYGEAPRFETAPTKKPGSSSGSSGSSGTPTPEESGGSSGSSNGGADGGTDGASSGGGTKPSSASLKIDGKTINVDDTELWAEVGGPGEYDIFIKVSGPGVAAGSDVHIGATSTGTGCDSTANTIAYRPKGDTQYMPKSANEPSCGLDIDELPKAVGGRFRGSFKSTLYGINADPKPTKSVELTFDVARAK
jgi:hypothetical protein